MIGDMLNQVAEPKLLTANWSVDSRPASERDWRNATLLFDLRPGLFERGQHEEVLDIRIWNGGAVDPAVQPSTFSPEDVKQRSTERSKTSGKIPREIIG
jgi:hypothetical protein